MSKHNQTIRLAVAPDQALLFCQEVFKDFGWRVQEVSGTGMTAKEVVPQLTGFTWPARIDVVLKGLGPADTELVIHGSIMGAGPIQSNHLKGQVGRFLNSLSVLIDKSTAGTSSSPVAVPATGLAAELRSLAELHAAGVLSDDEFASAKSKLLGGN